MQQELFSNNDCQNNETPSSLPPMLRYYLEVKKKLPEHLLLFQVGDFFEVFFEDAKTVSDCLSIRLTSRDKDKEDPIPMCGVPIHAIDSYIPKLLAAGFSCAFVEQTEDSSISKGPVRRELTKIVTPSVRLDNEGLSESQVNYICSFGLTEKRAEVSFFDASVGKLKIYKISQTRELETLINQFNPPEIIYDKKSIQQLDNTDYLEIIEDYSKLNKVRLINIEDRCPIEINSFKKIFFSEDLKEERIINVSTKISGSILLLFSYLDQIALSSSVFISSIEEINTNNQTLVLDSATIRNLELTNSSSNGDKKSSLQSVLDRTKTSQGSRLLNSWILNPLTEEDEINNRLDFIEELIKEDKSLNEIRELLSETRDLERLSVRISNGRISPYEIGQLRDTLSFIPRINEISKNLKSKFINNLRLKLDIMSDIFNLLDSSLNNQLPSKIGEGQIFKSDYNKDLERYLLLSTDSKTLVTSLEIKEKEESGISSLKIKYNSIFGYFIEVPKSQVDKVPIRYIRRQTLTNAERFITEDLSKIEKEVLSSEAKYKELERLLYQELKEELLKHLSRFKSISTFLSNLDVSCSLAIVSLSSGYVRPRITKDEKTIIKNGRHPVVEIIAGRSDFVPNNTYLGGEGRSFAILTGPNMGGKSTYLRQVGIIQILSQIGCYVPADAADIGIADRIFTRIGANDALIKGDSTFMVEMKEAALIINSSTSKSLVLIDEVGRGTSTTDGLALAMGIAEHLIEKNKCRTIFATHFHECTSLPDTYKDSFCISVGLVNTNSQVMFTHRIEEKKGSGSYGLVVAKLAGLPDSIINRAKEIVDSGITSSLNTSQDQNVILNNQIANDQDNKNDLLSLISVTNVDNLKPIEALNKLNYFVELAREVVPK